MKFNNAFRAIRSRLTGRRINGFAIPIHRSEDVSPFFIVGSGRCGSTLLRRILLHCSNVHIPSESQGMPSFIHAYLANPNLRWEDIVYLGVGNFEFCAEFNAAGISVAGVAPRLIKLPQEQRSVARVIVSIFEYHAQQSDRSGSIWGDKTPMYVFHLGTLQSVFPRARFIHIVRDGADVVESILRMNRHDYQLEQCAQRWLNSLTSFEAFSRRHSDLCREIAYESLIEQPVETVKSICEFIGADCRPSDIDRRDCLPQMKDVAAFAHHASTSEPISTSFIGRGRRSLNPEQKFRLNAIIGEKLEERGYAPLL
jgi:protein-tyrosine sulfotransferase